MKKTLFVILTILILYSVTSLGVDGYSSFSGKKVIKHLQGEIFYLKRNKDFALELWKSQANLDESVMLASNNDSENNNIVSYQLNGDQISYIAMKNGRWVKWAIDSTPGNKPLLVNEALDANDSSFEMKINDTNSVGTLFSKKGNLMLREPSGKVTELLHFNGIYDGKFSSGFVAPQWSPDGQFITFVYSGYRTPFTYLLTSLGKKILGTEDYNSQIYVMKYGSDDYYKYVRGSHLVWR